MEQQMYISTHLFLLLLHVSVYFYTKLESELNMIMHTSTWKANAGKLP